jgi:hypothetical protein
MHIRLTMLLAVEVLRYKPEVAGQIPEGVL